MGIGAVIAVAAIAGIIYLLVRPGYKPDNTLHTLTSVEAAAE